MGTRNLTIVRYQQRIKVAQYGKGNELLNTIS